MQGLPDQMKDALWIVQEFSVPEANDMPPGRPQFSRPLGILFRADVMLSAIELNHQSRSRTGEVGNVRADWMLWTKLEP